MRRILSARLKNLVEKELDALKKEFTACQIVRGYIIKNYL
jgi:hypothetical protein